MPEIDSRDYHDFVIRDGRLIGEFEQMYRKSADIPWHQDEQDDWMDVRLITQLLKDYAPFDYICDLGCGLGYFLDILSSRVGRKGCRTVGYEMSKTCREKAGAIFPAMEFRHIDLMDAGSSTSQDKRKGNEKRLFCIRGTLWYVFPKIEETVLNASNKTEEGDIFLVSQNFPPLGSNYVGKDTIPDPEAIIRLFGKYFEPLKSVFYEERLSSGNDNWFIAVFARRKNV